jgi:hypothetical protein
MVIKPRESRYDKMADCVNKTAVGILKMAMSKTKFAMVSFWWVMICEIG